MVSFRSVVLTFFLIGCGEEQKLDNSPTISITSHVDGDDIVENRLVQFQAQVADIETNMTDLLVEWGTSQGIVCPSLHPDTSGITTCEIALSLEDNSIYASVTDESGNQSIQTISLNVIESDAPMVEFLAPDENGRYHSDLDISFTGIVSDVEDASDVLTLQWSSSIDGILDALPTNAQSDGEATGVTQLSEGSHTIELFVIDTTNKSTSITKEITVLSPNQSPTCAIIQPTMSAVAIFEQDLTFEAEVQDVDAVDTTLSVRWASDVDGNLLDTTIVQGESVTFATNALSINTHQITLTVTDGLGAICTSHLEVIVGTPPSVSITSPSNNQIVDEGQMLTFDAQVQDGEDTPETLTLDWSIDGNIVYTQTADASGMGSYSTDTIPFGMYTLSLQVTDSTGLSSLDTLDFVVNGIPTMPSISLHPLNPYTTDDIQVSIDVDSVDPEGVPLQYEYAWSLNGVLHSNNTSTLSSVLTTQGDVWTVAVSALDGITSSAMASATVSIANTPPVLSNITLSPSSNHFNDDIIVCSVQVTDPDEILVPNYTWNLNGQVVGNTDTLDVSSIFALPNSTLECLASVTDSLGAVDQMTTTTTIGNRPPVVQSVEITPNIGVTTSSALSCGGIFSDPDGTTLTPRYFWSLNGQSIGESTSLQLGPDWVSPMDVIQCELYLDDGFGSIVSDTTTVAVENQIPVVQSVTLQYVSPLTSTSAVLCVVQGADADLQTLTPTYVWQNDTTGTLLNSATDTLPLDQTMVSPYDTISCSVTLSDGMDSSLSLSATATIQNTAPSFSSPAQISSTGLQVGDTWTCSAIGEDQDDGTLTVVYQWEDAQGIQLQTGASIEITASNSNPSESLTCVATITDIQGLITTSTTSKIVSNTAPSIISVGIDQNSIYTDDIISALVVYTDADESNDTSIFYDWYVTDASNFQSTLVQSGNDDTLDGLVHFDKYDTLWVEVTVSDSTDSVTDISNTVTVLNSPPTISHVLITPDPAYADFDQLTCTVTATDEDGDALQYTYIWSSAAGASHTVGASSQSTSTLDFVDVTGDDWTCTAIVDDGTETYNASYTITVEPSACDGISCGPDGTCNNFGSTYTCTCRPGFEGNNCELDIDECATNNGGCTGTRSDCINTMGAHYCIDASTVMAYPETVDANAEEYYNIAVISVNGRGAFPADPNDWVYSPYATYLQTWYDQNQLGDAIFDHVDGIKSFFTEASYSKANFQGVVVDWYDDYSTPKTDNDIFVNHDFYIQAAYDKIDPTQFDIFMVVGLAESGTTQIGWGMGNSVPAENGGRLFNKGITYLINSSFYNTAGSSRFGSWVLPSVPWAHELFHTIGIFGHSNSLWCYPDLTTYQSSITDDDLYYNASEALSDTCKINGYGDPFSLMGERLWASHPSVASKIEMGWVDDDLMTSIDATSLFIEQVVPLYPHNQSSISNNVAIQIYVPDFFITLTGGSVITMNRITIENRAVNGFDTYLSALGSGYRDYGSVSSWYLDTTYTWSYQYNTGIYDLLYPINTQGALIYIDSTDDATEVVYLIDANPASNGVITDAPSPKGYKGNAGKFANAMLNVGGTFSSDLLPFTLSIETGPDNGVNGDINVRITPVP